MSLTERECSVIAAAVGMARLLFEQARLRDTLRVAEADAEAARQLVERQRRQMKVAQYLDKHRLN